MKTCVVLLFILLTSTCCLSQDTTGSVVILNEKIGSTIDLNERNFYGMFKGIQHFESAILFQRPDGSYTFKIISKKKDENSITIRWLAMTEEEVELVRLHLDSDFRLKSSIAQHSDSPDHRNRTFCKAELAKLKQYQAVRFQIHQDKKIEANVIGVHGDSLTFTFGSLQQTVDIGMIDSLWVKGKATGRGAIIGGVIPGAVSFITLSLYFSAMRGGSRIVEADWDAILELSMANALIGSLIGAVIGNSRDIWYLRYAR